MKLFTFAAIAVLSVVQPLFADPVVDIPKVAGKEPAAVEKIIGKPTEGEKTKYGKKLVYQKGMVEIVYIKGKADWITINDLKDVTFDEAATKALGIEAAKPTFKGPTVIRWEPAGKLTSVAVFELEGKVDYAYVTRSASMTSLTAGGKRSRRLAGSRRFRKSSERKRNTP